MGLTSILADDCPKSVPIDANTYRIANEWRAVKCSADMLRWSCTCGFDMHEKRRNEPVRRFLSQLCDRTKRATVSACYHRFLREDDGMGQGGMGYLISLGLGTVALRRPDSSGGSHTQLIDPR